MNTFTGKGVVKRDVVYLSNSIVCTMSFCTGTTLLENDAKKNRYTFIKSIFLGNENDVKRMKEIIQENNSIEITGHLDSEQYITSSNKVVFNKILIIDDAKLIEDDG